MYLLNLSSLDNLGYLTIIRNHTLETTALTFLSGREDDRWRALGNTASISHTPRSRVVLTRPIYPKVGVLAERFVNADSGGYNTSLQRAF